MDLARTDRLRREQIDQYDVLDARPGRDLQALVDIAAQVCQVPNAAINIITEDQQHQIAAAGFSPSICARPDSMCAAVLEDAAPVVVRDASLDERFRTNPFVTGDIGDVRFYASAPLVTPEGVTIGRLCVFDSEVRRLDGTQEAALTQLAERVVDVLELRLRTRQLEDSLHELTRTRDELNRSNQQLTEFAAQVSHDLLNPLTAIIATTELLQHEPAVADDPDLLALARNATSSGHRMTAMIDQILRHARFGARLERRDVDLDALVDEVALDLRPLLEESGGSVKADGLGSVSGDDRQLYAVFQNLVSNALKFGRPGVPPEVRLSRHVEPGWVHITVEDNGVGVPPDQREAVFQRFSRAHQDVAGSGIGLATVRRIVEGHGGRIGLEAAPAGGTRAVVLLPDPKSLLEQ